MAGELTERRRELSDTPFYDTGTAPKVPKRILGTLMNSLSAGVVPRMGAPYIAIGRNSEIEALLSDLERVAEGGSGMRFVIGKYGSGKSFLLQLIRGYSLERGYVTIDCDLSPERKLTGGNNAGLSSYREMMRNMSIRSSPDGGALPVLLAKWISGIQSEIAGEGIPPESPEFDAEVEKKVYSLIRDLEGQVGGFDFASVISKWRKANKDGDDELASLCLRWLRGEYQTKTEAKRTLGVQSIINDSDWYEYIRLWAQFARGCGYKGLLVLIDECVNLYKIPNRVSRESNYEMILSMFNDSLQGRAPGVEIIMGGTPQFMEDTRRGLFSYEALKSRLTDGRFATGEYLNLMGPVIRLRRLSSDELYALITRLTAFHAQMYGWEPKVTADEAAKFLEICESRAGADTMITPREIIRDYLSILNILYQNREATFTGVIEKNGVKLVYTNDDEAEEITHSSVSEQAAERSPVDLADLEF